MAQGLACRRGGRDVFAGVGFEVRSGEILELRGPNGVGKSSLLRLVAGLVDRTAGDIALQGGDEELTLPEQAHYVGHLDAIKPPLTVLENLRFWGEMLGEGSVEPRAALEAVGLSALAQFPAYTLSAGQRRRLSLARLLCAKRPVWLLDEPTTALDRASRETLYGLVRAHAADGGLTLVATHDDLPLQARRLEMRRAA
ncbi:ABC transporter involved in cytochrome c biogenesis, ATPase component CcmA [Lutibaculum baratangense AMV1]|uniref:ABC transporter involved in cytochrome c biogenesis, ATPase component CcmA n=1 Tax=Lutibaculum baratangense AMV1 TaxID=631454 RepID=V4R207_9HYPH|nr:ABC transporter involved in cytochrome c biogenesis, ATPase component CcmA [Lutibaculum baratangense AMV1]